MLREAEWVAVDRTRPSYRDLADAPDRFAVAYAKFRANDRFELVFAKDGILVFRLRAGSSAAGGTP